AVASLLIAGLVVFAPQLSATLGVGDPIVRLPTPAAPPANSARPSPAGPSGGVSASATGSAQAEPTDAVPSDVPTGSGGSAPPSARSPRPGSFHVGEPAPPLTLPLLGGGSVDLASLKGKPVWLNFMATYCPPCRDEFPVMSAFQ